MSVTEWVTRDFKALAEGRLRFEPGVVNVITGQNSSGKSSLIQSVLAATQSYGQNGSIILNGPLVRLGTLKDTVQAGKSAFVYELVLANKDQEDYRAVLTVGPANRSENALKADPVLTEVNIQRLSGGEQKSSGQQRPELTLKSPKLSKFAARDQRAIRKVSQYRQSSILKISSIMDEVTSPPSRTYVEFAGIEAKAIHICGSDDALRSLFKRYFRERLHAMAHGSAADRFGFTGQSFYIRQAAEESKEMDDKYRRYLELSDSDGPKRPLNRAINDLAQTLAERQLAEAKDECITINIPDRRLDEFALGFVNGFSPASEYFSYYFPKCLNALALLNLSSRFLARKVCYLGPLRDEPRILSSHTSEQSPNLPVGSRGEYSAYVLNRFGHEEIEFADETGNTRLDSLTNAVGYWLEKIGVATGVSVSPEANLGLRLGVQIGDAERDLTQVGVGVSQVLPVVVGLLRTPSGGCFLTEQPELHLHPATQANLADFLLVSRPDVCVVVETHSEAIVTRVRRRTAEKRAETGDVNLIFVETEEENGGARTRSIEITGDGEIVEWPEGFLDDGADLREIMKIRAGKMRQKFGH